MLVYFTLSSISLGFGYLFYLFILKKEKTFIFNRFFLQIVLILSLLAPTLKIDNDLIPPVFGELNTREIVQKLATEEIPQIAETIYSVNNQSHILELADILFIIYCLVTVIMLIRFARNLINIINLAANKGPRINNLQLIYSVRQTSPFSFFNYVFVDKNKALNEAQLLHEQAHSVQLHSLDILLIEFISCFYWFNPIIWMYKKAISENHEYLADQYVTNRGINTKEYTINMLDTISTMSRQNLSSGFSFVHTKNRIMMLNKEKSPMFARLSKYIISVLLIAVVITFSSFNSTPKKYFLVVVDAAHGGHDNGIEHQLLKEKDIVLDLARQLKAMNNDEELIIKLTREDDRFVGLFERVEFATQVRADLFLSLHLNGSKAKSNSGLEVYYPNNTEFKNRSISYSMALFEDQIKANFSKGAIKTAPFIVLSRAKSPSLLMELGYLSNDTDRDNLTNPAYRNKLAKTIYGSLLKIKDLATED